MAHLKTIASYMDLPIAELARARLDAEGIYCYLANRHMISIDWSYSNALGGILLQVREDDEQTALEIISEDQSSVLTEIEDTFPSIEAEDYCTRCGSANLDYYNIDKKFGALSLLLGFPIMFFFRKRYKCNACGHIMKQ